MSSIYKLKNIFFIIKDEFKKKFEIILKNIKNELKSNLESVILFGSQARGDSNEKSDIDILIITNNKINEEKLEKKLRLINYKIEIQCLEKEEFKEKVINFNHQLISIFMDGIVFYDKNKFYYKMENLFLALNRKKDFTLKVKRRVIKLQDLIRNKNFM